MMIKNKFFSIILAVFFLYGCFTSSPPPSAVTQYHAIDYPTPPMIKKWDKKTTLKLEFISSLTPFTHPEMVWQNRPYSREILRRQRWLAPPNVMVEHLFLRDLKQALPSLIVLSREDMENGRFVLEGRIMEFLGEEREGVSFARLSLHLILIDTDERDPIKRIVLQKAYGGEDKLSSRTPSELARGMSVVLERLSREVTKDLEKVIHERLYR
ncbi:MAG: ABC-type transport auxiliary lipoprotein family protein [Syntrophales bacterium]|nr:ABC-type transport auxiliary lipoprotein family protein [Syntrophales bacterium]